jgi:hypothetical protein
MHRFHPRQVWEKVTGVVSAKAVAGKCLPLFIESVHGTRMDAVFFGTWIERDGKSGPEQAM